MKKFILRLCISLIITSVIVLATFVLDKKNIVDIFEKKKVEKVHKSIINKKSKNKKTEISIVFSGDILPHSPINNKFKTPIGYNYEPAFSLVKDKIQSADIAICHLETTLVLDNSKVRSYPLFRAPKDLATSIKNVGYDGCSTAGNHALDNGNLGVGETIKILEAAGLKHTGTATSEQSRSQGAVYEVKGKKIVQFSYAYGWNGFSVPTDQPYLASAIDANKMLEDAKNAKENGADFVVVSMHAGDEYVTLPNIQQKEVADKLLNSPYVDLIIGHHVHVVQPASIINNKVILFGLGNFLSNQSDACCPVNSQDGTMATVKIKFINDKAQVKEVSILPTYVERSTYTIIPLLNSNGSNSFYNASYLRTEKTLDLLGAISKNFIVKIQR